MTKSRWAIFVSGQGSNLGALIDARHEALDASIDLVFSSKAQAPALLQARRAGIATEILSSSVDWSTVLKTLHDYRITHIFLAGFMKIVPADFLKLWAKPVFNVHPSLLPHYPGLRSIERALSDSAALGVTVHEVNEQVDGGRILAQKTVYAAGAARGLAPEEINFYMHLAEYELVKKTFREASCSM